MNICSMILQLYLGVFLFVFKIIHTCRPVSSRPGIESNGIVFQIRLEFIKNQSRSILMGLLEQGSTTLTPLTFASRSLLLFLAESGASYTVL